MTTTSKPIAFKAPMVRAILDGRKSMTRQLLKPSKSAHGHMQPAKEKYAVGDTLWVQEAWQTHVDLDKVKPSELPRDTAIQYPATYDGWVSRKRPGMFMPRWASRIDLRVTAVKVERVQDISEAEAIAEGCGDAAHPDMAALFADNPSAYAVHMATTGIDPVTLFEVLWDSIHGDGAWERNDWVAAYTFERLK